MPSPEPIEGFKDLYLIQGDVQSSFTNSRNAISKSPRVNMEAIFKQIKDEYAKTDDNGKRQIQGYIRELQVGFYSDWDVVMRLSSGVSVPLEPGDFC